MGYIAQLTSALINLVRCVFRGFRTIRITINPHFVLFYLFFMGNIKYRIPAYPYTRSYEQGEDQSSRKGI